MQDWYDWASAVAEAQVVLQHILERRQVNRTFLTCEMGRAMARAKRSIQFAIAVDGFALEWHLHREQQWSEDDGWRGVAIHVKNTVGVRRELFLEYPAVGSQRRGYVRIDPVRQNILPAKVKEHIQQAIEAGWDPGSRGQPFVHEVAELPG